MTAVLALCLLLALAILAIASNNASARLSLVEVMLNEGLPPGYEIAHENNQPSLEPPKVATLLGPGVHVFLSRSCHACMRLVDELDQHPLLTAADAPKLHLRYVDRPRPIAASAAAKCNGTLHAQQHELIAHVGANPLPYTIVVGAHQAQSRSVTPSRKSVIATARDAGLVIDEGQPAASGEPIGGMGT